MNQDQISMLRSINQIEAMIRPRTADGIEMLVATLEAMGSGETIRKALARLRERALERDIRDADELVRALYDIGEARSL